VAGTLLKVAKNSLKKKDKGEGAAGNNWDSYYRTKLTQEMGSNGKKKKNYVAQKKKDGERHPRVRRATKKRSRDSSCEARCTKSGGKKNQATTVHEDEKRSTTVAKGVEWDRFRVRQDATLNLKNENKNRRSISKKGLAKGRGVC